MTAVLRWFISGLAALPLVSRPAVLLLKMLATTPALRVMSFDVTWFFCSFRGLRKRSGAAIRPSKVTLPKERAELGNF